MPVNTDLENLLRLIGDRQPYPYDPDMMYQAIDLGLVRPTLPSEVEYPYKLTFEGMSAICHWKVEEDDLEWEFIPVPEELK